jgi:hypothetical protein
VRGSRWSGTVLVVPSRRCCNTRGVPRRRTWPEPCSAKRRPTWQPERTRASPSATAADGPVEVGHPQRHDPVGEHATPSGAAPAPAGPSSGSPMSTRTATTGAAPRRPPPPARPPVRPGPPRPPRLHRLRRRGLGEPDRLLRLLQLCLNETQLAGEIPVLLLQLAHQPYQGLRCLFASCPLLPAARVGRVLPAQRSLGGAHLGAPAVLGAGPAGEGARALAGGDRRPAGRAARQLGHRGIGQGGQRVA